MAEAWRGASTLDLRPHRGFEQHFELLHDFTGQGLLNSTRVAWRVIRAAWRRQPTIAFSSWGPFKPEVLAAAVVGMLPARRRPGLVMVGEMWQPTPGWRLKVERLVVRLADRGVDRYLVPTDSERQTFPQLWGVGGDGRTRTAFFPFKAETYGIDLNQCHLGDHVFAGGDSFRDYGPLLEVARRMPQTRFVLATHQLAADDPSLPDNVRVHPGRIGDYFDLAKGAGVFVAPLQLGLSRSVGILTVYLGMFLGKPVVVSDAFAVRDFLDDGRTGLIYDGSAAALEAALRWCLDPANTNEAAALGRAAHDVVTHDHSFTSYVDTILAELADVVAARRIARGEPAPRVVYSEP